MNPLMSDATRVHRGVERHVDRIPDPAAPQPREHILAEKGAIHANADRRGRRGRRPELRPTVAQKPQRRLSVMHIAGAVLHAQDMRGLRQVREDRVVARHLPVMRIEASTRAVDLQPGRHDDAVDIDRDRAQPQPRHDLRDHRRVHPLPPLDGRHGEGRQPPTDGPRSRHHAHLAEATEDRVIGRVREVAQAPPADHEQPDQQPHHRHGPKVAAQRRVHKRIAHHAIEVDATQVLLEQLEACVGRELNIAELEREIRVDTAGQIGFSSSHCRWPFGRGRRVWLAPPFNHKRKAFSIPVLPESPWVDSGLASAADEER